ncbi:MAG: hypothetical protein ACD_28C00400G0001 [uncultured bacterium]|nr:MAG: hypothetical protein ACD_28C00400G0001 [uncultured bacterium]
MARGLPTLQPKKEKDGLVGEYVRMNKGQLEVKTFTWTDDETLDSSRACSADWDAGYGYVGSDVRDSNFRSGYLGSRGVLRVNLNFES